MESSWNNVHGLGHPPHLESSQEGLIQKQELLILKQDLQFQELLIHKHHNLWGSRDF